MGNKIALSQFTKNTTLAFHASWKIKENILENHSSWQLWKSRFTRKKLAISHFMGKKKGPIKSHENTLYHTPLNGRKSENNSLLR